MSEPLDENQYGVGMVSRGKHVLHINDLDNAAKAHRLSALKAAMQPVVTLAPTHMESGEWVSKYGATVRYTHTSRGKGTAPWFFLKKKNVFYRKGVASENNENRRFGRKQNLLSLNTSLVFFLPTFRLINGLKMYF